mmetsp:Transcript_13172/g.34479  ORF Transcript_13172/g.34479 Transcript_13172/m.34479 type:complete len:161 (-) Transcript_13172:850-1332(-)
MREKSRVKESNPLFSPTCPRFTAPIRATFTLPPAGGMHLTHHEHTSGVSHQLCKEVQVHRREEATFSTFPSSPLLFAFLSLSRSTQAKLHLRYHQRSLPPFIVLVTFTLHRLSSPLFPPPSFCSTISTECATFVPSFTCLNLVLFRLHLPTIHPSPRIRV